MDDGPDIVTLGMLIGQPTRAAMLLALLDGRGRTATELADIAETARPTASFHLSQMLEGRVLRVDRQGRHRYYRLAGAGIAELLESLLVLAERPRPREARFGPRPAHMRHARMCYDHIAGTLGIGLVDGLVRSGALVEGADCFHLTGEG
ncbi:MAG TPA: winged helix-turn-helix domain-containing protein, partial [Thermomicrobiales bacterium]|nr:winged helix-turn-helix domain-containing protein [Thermomicrobiales bacterium]